MSLIRYVCGTAVLFLLAQPGHSQHLRDHRIRRPQCLDFDGVNDRFTVPFSATFPTTTFTLAAWIKTAQQPPERVYIVTRGEDDVTDLLPWGLYVETNGHLGLAIGNNSDIGQFMDSGASVADGQWHHVAATRTAAHVVNLFVDGQVRATIMDTLVPATSNTQDMTMGCALANTGFPPPGGHVPGYFVDGRIDDVAIWNVPLTTAQVNSLFLGNGTPPLTGLVGLWLFGDFGGQVGKDSSGNFNHGTRGASVAPGTDDPTWVYDEHP